MLISLNLLEMITLGIGPTFTVNLYMLKKKDVRNRLGKKLLAELINKGAQERINLWLM